MSGVRYFTLEEAIATLPRLRPLLASLRDAFHEYRFAREQWEELRRLHGEALDAPDHPEHAEAARWRDETDRRGQVVQALVDEIVSLGADVKDPTLGLVDFFAYSRDGRTVLLCYRDDEDTIRYWHPLDTGFSGRKPIDEL